MSIESYEGKAELDVQYIYHPAIPGNSTDPEEPVTLRIIAVKAKINGVWTGAELSQEAYEALEREIVDVEYRK